MSGKQIQETVQKDVDDAQGKQMYNDYKRTVSEQIVPNLTVKVDDSNPLLAQVHVDVDYNGESYYLESVTYEDVVLVHEYLFGQPLTRSKYMTGLPASKEETAERVSFFAERFKKEVAKEATPLLLE